jgi:hypothetical protein
MSYREVARKLRCNYWTANKWCKRFGYHSEDGRKNGHERVAALLLDFAGVDWRKSNQAISNERGQTREWIRQVRQTLGKKKVESRGRKKTLTNSR